MVCRGKCLRGMEDLVEISLRREPLAEEMHQVRPSLGQLLLPRAPGAEAVADTIGTDPLTVILGVLQVDIVEVLEAEAAVSFPALVSEHLLLYGFLFLLVLNVSL